MATSSKFDGDISKFCGRIVHREPDLENVQFYRVYRNLSDEESLSITTHFSHVGADSYQALCSATIAIMKVLDGVAKKAYEILDDDRPNSFAIRDPVLVNYPIEFVCTLLAAIIRVQAKSTFNYVMVHPDEIQCREQAIKVPAIRFEVRGPDKSKIPLSGQIAKMLSEFIDKNRGSLLPSPAK